MEKSNILWKYEPKKTAETDFLYLLDFFLKSTMKFVWEYRQVFFPLFFSHECVRKKSYGAELDPRT